MSKNIKTPQMLCRLCREKSDLKESHIIPEAFYEKLYDGKHRALPIFRDNRELKLIQKGIREKLLCGECENKFSRWETILKRDLVDIGNKKSNFLRFSDVEEDIFKVEGIRYQEFKLAVLSILWRMSVTSDPLFANYNLGKYEEELRQKLLCETVLDEKQYPLAVSRVLST